MPGPHLVSTSVNYADIHPELSFQETIDIIRSQHIRYTDVTIVLAGKDTWRRRYIDWEIAASLKPRRLGGLKRKGLIGIRIDEHFVFPDRLQENIYCGYAVETNFPSKPIYAPGISWNHEFLKAVNQASENAQSVRPVTRRPLKTTNHEGAARLLDAKLYNVDLFDHAEIDRLSEIRWPRFRVSAKKRKRIFGTKRTNEF